MLADIFVKSIRSLPTIKNLTLPLSTLRSNLQTATTKTTLSVFTEIQNNAEGHLHPLHIRSKRGVKLRNVVSALQLLFGVCRSWRLMVALLERTHDQEAVGIDADVAMFPKLLSC